MLLIRAIIVLQSSKHIVNVRPIQNNQQHKPKSTANPDQGSIKNKTKPRPNPNTSPQFRFQKFE